MTKAEKKKYDAMASALRAIHWWAEYCRGAYDTIPHAEHGQKLKNCAETRLKALEKKK